MDRMLASTKRAQTYLNDLLSYSQIRSKSQPTTPVNLNELIKNVLLHFSLIINKTKAQVETGALPTVIADPYMMRQLFQNLIGNALKFRGTKPLTICVKCEPAGEMFHFTVEDNGIGIKSKFHKN